MSKYRKKPVVIEALQWNGLNLNEIKNFVGNKASIVIHNAGYEAGVTPPVAVITIHTLEGNMNISVNDFIIKGVNGEFYPCKPDIFEKTYEKVED